MASYYDDLLGHIADDPLQKLNAQEMGESQVKPDAQVRTKVRKVSQVRSKAKTELAERRENSLMNSVVIPAAFPKFAPPKEEKATQTEIGTELEQETKKSDEALAPVIQEELITPPQPRAESRAEVTPNQIQTQETNKIEVPDEDVAVGQAVQQEVVEENLVKEPEEWLSNGRPVWAQNRFECLLFSVAGLKLAVPLISLGAIYQIEKEFTPLVGRADWFMGLYRTHDRNIQVVDTAKWVMPDRYHDQVIDGYQFVIRLGGNNWGMACDSVHESIQLDPAQVKWRSERSKRPWLSGTVIDHMCALLDADMLGYLLQKDQRAH